MVRLLRIIMPLINFGYRSFNPTMVRLLRNSLHFDFHSVHLFQSHNGAIAAIIITLLSLVFAMFQSHNGAIAALQGFGMSIE